MKCQATGCNNEATGRPLIQLVAVSDEKGSNPAQFHLDVPLCKSHQSPDPSAYVSDEGWDTLVTNMRAHGLQDPDRNRLKVFFVPLEAGTPPKALN
jgi:hypothetical protein